ncbi:MAG: hypothetical protein LUI87_15580 [Lachnospiraceae bacterium]|nr:hypothetical protein [Lachnospiraceae bacterium]
MKVKIGYKTFYSFLKKSDYGYTEEEIKNLFLSVRAMDEESRGWVINWINGKGLPRTIVEDVTADFLVNEVGMQPINALIALDWLKHEPEMAKYYIMKLAKDNSEKDAAEADMRKIAEEFREKEKDSEDGSEDKKKTLEAIEEEKKEALKDVEELTLEGVI